MRLFLILAVQVCLVVWSFGSAGAYFLPDTGQTKCYQSASPWAEIPCADTGQDGEYNINPMSYTDYGNGTVTDNNTGLMWQKCSMGQNNDSSCSGDAGIYNWYQASGTYDATYNSSSQNVCGSLNRGGHTDWRLPTDQELQTIIDYAIPCPGSAIRTAYFPNTIASYYWSSTTRANGPYDAWSFHFCSKDNSVFAKSNTYYVRCVRGGE